jgi:hypothetical protein
MAGVGKDDSKKQTAGANISAKERFDASECLPKLFLVSESDCEIEGWVPLLRDFYYLGADIDAFLITCSDGSQKVAGSQRTESTLFCGSTRNRRRRASNS